MILNSFFDKIFIINLKQSIDRKNHMVHEFEKMKITNYEFFEATHFEEEEVDKLLNSKKVFSFPPCFRCLKNRCKCENNFLTKYQIANWLSYIKLFNKILESEYNFVLICEDDIAFQKNSEYILNNLLNDNTFLKYKINKDKPLLLKMGAAYDIKTHLIQNQPSFIKNYSLSNPCFALNKAMIQVFLYNLKIIDYHSDIYFHKKIPMNFKNVQMFVMNPFPVYELSFVKDLQKFDSLVRPKNQLRRKEYHDFLFVTIHKLLEYVPLEYTKNLKINVSNKIIDYNGTINYYYILKKEDQEKFYFKNKIFIFDNQKDDIEVMKNDICFKKDSHILHIIYLVLEKYNLNIKNDKTSVLNNIEQIYPHILHFFEENNFLIIDINKDNIFDKYNITNKYIQLKNSLYNRITKTTMIEH